MADEQEQLEFLFTGNNEDLKRVVAENESLIDKQNAKVASSSGVVSNAESTIASATAKTGVAVADTTKTLETRAATAAQTATTIVNSEKTLAQTFESTQAAWQASLRGGLSQAEYIAKQNELGKAQVAAMVANYGPNNVNAYTPHVAPSGPSVRDQRIQENQQFLKTAEIQAEKDLEAGLAIDRAKWAGDAIRNAEAIALSRNAITKSDKVAEAAGKDIIKAEKGIEEATKDVTGTAAKAVSEFGEFGAAGGVLETVVAGLGTTAGLTVVGVAALAAGVGVAAGGLYEAATSAGEFGSHLQDMSDKTGLSANTLLTLDTAAKSSGSSLERLINSVGILEKRLGNADTATDRVSKGLKKWGIDAEDPNKALEQIIAHLAKFPEGVKRTQVAMDVFGIAGKDFAAITKVMDGDMVAYREELAKMGIELGGNALENTVKFKEEQVRLGQQWDVLKFKIQSAATPIVEEWLKGISEWLTKNQKDILEWGESFVKTAGTIINAVASVFSFLSEIGPMAIPVYWVYQGFKNVSGEDVGMPAGPKEGDTRAEKDYRTGQNQQYTYKGGQWQITPLGNETEGDQTFGKTTWQRHEEPNPFARETKGGRGGGRQDDPAKHAMEMEKERLKQAIAGFDFEKYQWEDMLKNKTVSLETFTKEAIGIEVDRSKATLSTLEKEYEQAGQLKKPDQREIKQLQIRGQIEQEKQRLIKASNELIYGLDQDAIEKSKVQDQTRLAIFEVTSKEMEDKIKDDVDYRIITAEQGAAALTDIELKLNERRQALLEIDLSHEKEGSLEYLRIQGELAKSEAEHAAIFEKGERDQRDAHQKTLEDQRQFVDQMLNFDKVILDSRLSTARQVLSHQINTGQILDPNAQRAARDYLDTIEENARYLQEQAATRSRWRVDLEKKTYDEIIQINEKYLGVIDAAEKAHQVNLQIIQERKLEDLHREVQQLAQTAANTILDAGEEAITNGFTAGLKKIGDSVKQVIKNALERELEQSLTAVFDRLSTGGGVFGGLFKILTGVDIGGKDGQQQTVQANTDSLQTLTQSIDNLNSTMGGTPSGIAGITHIPGLGGLFSMVSKLHIFSGGSGAEGGSGGALAGGIAGALGSGAESPLTAEVVGHRQFGGPVDAGKLYRVHDREYFRPNSDGYVVPERQTAQVQPKMGGVNVIAAVGDRAIAQAVDHYAMTGDGKHSRLVQAKYDRKYAKLTLAG